jgi:catechol 2,3-dioxygenase-like lactoylglutathione lyase family enzyme
MTMTTRIQSISVPVDSQDRALAFYTTVLGCEVRADHEAFPGARWIEVVPPGSTVSLVLLTRDSEIPIGVRLSTDDADVAHRTLTAAGTTPETEVLRLEIAPPMFEFHDPDGNTLIYIEEASGEAASIDPFADTGS